MAIVVWVGGVGDWLVKLLSEIQARNNNKLTHLMPTVEQASLPMIVLATLYVEADSALK